MNLKPQHDKSFGNFGLIEVEPLQLSLTILTNISIYNGTELIKHSSLKLKKS